MTYIDIVELTIDGEKVDFSNAFIEVSESNGLKSWRVEIMSTKEVLAFRKDILNIHAVDTASNRYSGDVTIKRQTLELNGNYIELLGTGPLRGYPG